MLCLAVCWVACYFTIWKGVKSSGRVCDITKRNANVSHDTILSLSTGCLESFQVSKDKTWNCTRGSVLPLSRSQQTHRQPGKAEMAQIRQNQNQIVSKSVPD